jgi:hypothetical protein
LAMQCPSGTVAISGGGGSTTAQVNMYQDNPLNGSGHPWWGVAFYNPTASSATIFGYAVCVSGS